MQVFFEEVAVFVEFDGFLSPKAQLFCLCCIKVGCAAGAAVAIFPKSCYSVPKVSKKRSKAVKRLIGMICICACLLGLMAPALAAGEASHTQAVWVNGQEKAVSAFKVGGTHYFKLRDIARALSGTEKAIDLAWDDAAQLAIILPGQNYSPLDTEGEGAPAPDFSGAVANVAQVQLGEETCALEAYLVQGHNYCKLRDVLALLDVGAFWDGRAEKVHLDTAYPYLAEGYTYESHENVVIFMYHDFTYAPGVAPEQIGVTTTAQKFEADIRALLAAGYESLSLEELYLGKAEPEKKYFVLTCDDGYLSNFNIAFPILQRLGVHMDIFINTDNTNLSHHFSLYQARIMEQSGLVRIYSHYPSHVDLTQVEAAELETELRRSLDTLEGVLDRKNIYFFAYPHGAYNESTVAAVSTAGYAMQLAQDPYKTSDQLWVRVNVSHDSDILALAERAYKN